MFHCGSRGFGHQIATDYLQSFLPLMKKKFGIELPDRDLACAPFASPEGQAYFAAMKCAINMSFANRQVILHRIREVFADVLQRDPRDLGMQMVYDVAHNTAKLEEHEVGGTAAPPAGAPQGGDARLRPRHAGRAGGVPRHRPAGDHRRQHGDRLLPAARHAVRRGRPSSPPRTAAAGP